MGIESRFRGDRGVDTDEFDWLTPAEEFQIPLEEARALYEEALQQALYPGAQPAQAHYLERLAERTPKDHACYPGRFPLTTKPFRRRRLRQGHCRTLGKRPLTAHLPGPRSQPTSPTEPLAGLQGFPSGYDFNLPAASGDAHAATLYRQAVAGGAPGLDDPAVEQALARVGGGQALSTPVRRMMELALRAPLDRVRVHTDAVAIEATRAVQAKAFTVGEDIFFANGEYAPDTAAGQELLAHELTHVVQAHQRRTETNAAGIRVSQPDDALEREADTVAARIASLRSPLHAPSSPRGVLPAATSAPRVAMLLRTPQPGQAAIADRALARTSLAVAAGGRSYQISVVRRGGLTVIVAQLSGSAEKLEVPLPAETAASLTATFGERVIEPHQSSLDVAISGGTGGARRYHVEIVPSPYESTNATGRPDRVRISDGAGVVEKDLYPAGSATRLSPRDAQFSTVVRLPPSGRARAPVNMVLEMSASPTGRGAAVTLNLQKTGQRRSVPVDVDLSRATIRLVGQQALAPDALGNPQVRVELEVVDTASQRTAKVLQLTFISWVNAGTVEEGYTYAVTDLLSGATARDGFLVPPSASGDFHVRTLTDTGGTRATVSESQAYNAQLTTASAGGLSLHLRRDAPTSTTVRLVLSTRGGGDARDFNLTYAGARLQPRIVEDTGGTAGRLVVSLDGSDRRDLLLTWNSTQVSGEYPFLEGFDHVVLRNVSSTRLGLNLVAPGIEPWSESWYAPPLPDDCITPPKWRRLQLGSVNGWMRLSDRRFVRAEWVDTQVAGARMGEILMQAYAIGYLHAIPFVGEAVMIGEAAAGREIISGRRLDRTERTLLALFGGLGVVLQSAAALRGLSGEARAARLAVETQTLQRTASLSETEARALLQAADRAISPEERAFLEALRSDLQGGRAIGTADVDRLRTILARLDNELQAQRQILGLLDARMQQIQAARGDLNVFRARFRGLTGFGNAPQDLTTVAARLDELLTPFRRVRVVTGGGRGGAGVSTYIEALDGRFSIRVTHNQVGPAPVGNPPAPRIHIYEGQVSGHGTHIVLPNGTTLDDILRALRLL